MRAIRIELMMEEMMFKPWIGKQYGNPNNVLGGTKLLVLGESHYGNVEKMETEHSTATSEVVEQLAIKENHRFFTGLTQVISGKKKWEMTRQEVSDLWLSVGFYNYVPVYVSSEARVRPQSEMFRMGAKPFETVLSDLKPDAILVCGFGLWWWLLKNHLPDLQGDPAQTPFTKIGGAVAARMKHPSSAFSTDRWRPTVIDLLERARRGAN